MTIEMKCITLFAIVLLNASGLLAQQVKTIDTIGYWSGKIQKNYVLELRNQAGSKIKKKFLLKKGRKVWIQLSDSTSKSHLTKARISDIQDHQVSIKILKKPSQTIIFSDSTLSFIGFTSTGRVMTAGVVNTVLVGAGITGGAVIICVVVLQASMIVLAPILIFIAPELYRGTNFGLFNFDWVGPAFKGVGQLFRMTLPFKKKVHLDNDAWKSRTKEVESNIRKTSRILSLNSDRQVLTVN